MFKMKRIAIFASGSGTNAQRIAEYFSTNSQVSIVRIYCNNPEAFVLTRARRLNIPSLIFVRKDLYQTDLILNQLHEDNTDLIVLAGFLWLVPVNILSAFENRIINIHPALLPRYGGKGKYGHYVHAAVIDSGDKESGISIHFVNERYDEGDIVFQARCHIEKGETTESLAAKIHELEYEHFPVIIDQVIQSLK
jgi:phosphoribosylglycinamide formyltransferase-1